MRSLFIILLISAGAVLVSCNSNQQSGYLAQKKSTKNESATKSLEKVNRYMVNAENKEIDDYIRRHRWNMKTTGSGLRYEIYKQGNGPAIKKGDVVSLKYGLFLINGVMVYSSDKLGLKTFEVGHGGVETGLEEAMLLMHKGDKAHLILPSHLAYGLNGDGKKIPKRSTVIYNIEIIDVK